MGKIGGYWFPRRYVSKKWTKRGGKRHEYFMISVNLSRGMNIKKRRGEKEKNRREDPLTKGQRSLCSERVQRLLELPPPPPPRANFELLNGFNIFAPRRNQEIKWSFFFFFAKSRANNATYHDVTKFLSFFPFFVWWPLLLQFTRWSSAMRCWLFLFRKRIFNGARW